MANHSTATVLGTRGAGSYFKKDSHFEECETCPINFQESSLREPAV